MTIERFYIVQNYKEGFIRAWHGHKKETKTAYVVTGAALFYAIEMNEETMPLNKVPLKWVLDERTQGILIIHQNTIMVSRPLPQIQKLCSSLT